MQGSEPRKPPLPPVYGGIVNRIKNHAFSLEEYRTRMAQVWADFEEYLRTLSDVEKRIKALEEKGRG